MKIEQHIGEITFGIEMRKFSGARLKKELFLKKIQMVA